MLSHVLGVLIAFVTVILLLSMVVMGLVQATQAMLRLRSRNLQQGVAALIVKHKPSNAPRSQYRRQAAGILNADNLAVLEKVDNGESWTRRILGPKVSWADPTELATAVFSAVGGASAVTSKEAIESDLRRMEPALSKRFRLFIRLWTIFWSFIVAAAFQVSTPDLLSSFATGARSTQPYVNATGRVLALGAQEGLGIGTDDDMLEQVGTQALDRLNAEFPQYGNLIAQAGVGGTDIADLSDELSDVLHGVTASDREAVLSRYRTLLTSLTASQAQQVIQSSEDAEAQLAAFGIRFWSQGKTFYYDPPKGGFIWGAILGVLMTGVLMSFGAPFWFKQLQLLASLRDAKAPQLPTGK